MPLDNLPAKLVTLTRDQRRDKFLRDLLVRNPAEDTRPGSQAYLDASVFADATDVHVSNAVTIANNVSRATATGQALDDWAARAGTERQPATGGAGSVLLPAALPGSSTSSTTLFAGDRLVHASTGLNFQVTADGTYRSGDQVPIVGVDTGLQTNLAAGTILTFLAPRPGCSPTATIVAQPDGSGLSGGAPEESDDDLQRRLDYIAAHPPASGNDAEYQDAIFKTPLVAVQQPFTYPCCNGPGTIGTTFTLRPAIPGSKRGPGNTQLAIMAANIQGSMPADDGAIQILISNQSVVVVLKVLWAQGSASWVDNATWPPYFATPNLVNAVADGSGVRTATQFRLTSASLSSSTAPQVGQSIAFLDSTGLAFAFRRKKLLTVSVISATQYDVTVDTTNGVSDTTYAPTSGQACCPWSDSLNTLIAPVVAYFDTLGPGEMFSTFFDAGLRQKRSPASPQYWPNVITNRLLGGSASPKPQVGITQTSPPVPTLLTTSSLQDVVLIEPAIPFATPVGVPGVSVKLLALGNLLAFPE